MWKLSDVAVRHGIRSTSADAAIEASASRLSMGARRTGSGGTGGAGPVDLSSDRRSGVAADAFGLASNGLSQALSSSRTAYGDHPCASPS
jgi:hypothetical protein